MQDVAILGKPLRITGTVSNLNAPMIIGVIVAASTAGTIKIDDTAQAGGTTQLNTTTLTAGTFLPLYMKCAGNTTVTVGGTLDATLILAG